MSGASEGGKTRLRWKWLLISAVTASTIYVPIIISGSGGWELLYWICLSVFAFYSIVLAFLGAIMGKWRNALFLLGMVAACILVSFLLLWKAFVMKTYTRWAFFSGTYKKELLTQPTLAQGKLQHMDWDGWGFGGQDTYVYLVHDPQDRLRAAVQTHYGLQAERLPCKVSDIHRLEKDWYTVTFLVDAEWTNC